MKIAFLTYSMTGGGAERVISVLANRFCAEDDVAIMQLSDLERSMCLMNVFPWCGRVFCAAPCGNCQDRSRQTVQGGRLGTV